MTLHWQTSGQPQEEVLLWCLLFPRVIMPWSCLVDLMDDLYTVGGNTCVVMLKLFHWVQLYEVLLL